MATQFTSVDEYVASFPENIQKVLTSLRETIRKELPSEAEEVMSYNIPTYKMHGNYVIYFSAWNDHISVYPIPKGNDELQQAVAPFASGKGTLKFPLDKPVPLDLVKKITQALLRGNETRNS
jgi:uncharacterized protein YdhG (YjbR/CyaY superfamily)